ncbi:MAG: UbiX family flavin prenyltransferase [Candidatus Binataceae bacterium]|nr:UbiX family flavin prenyltransferase [Candidatus Binataceae bacterium]
MRRLIVGLTGASGIVYGVRMIDRLREIGDVEVHLVMTDAARITLSEELGMSQSELGAKVAVLHNIRNIAASIASGSFVTAGMVVVPCSMNTLAAIAYCQSNNLLTRAADVCLKERRPLILLPRETPLHLGHLRAMVAAAEMGSIMLPPVPAFYFGPKTIDDLINHTIGKIFDQLGFGHALFPRWGENEATKPGGKE